MGNPAVPRIFIAARCAPFPPKQGVALDTACRWTPRERLLDASYKPGLHCVLQLIAGRS